MPHSHHRENTGEHFFDSKTENITDINIGGQDAENWRRFLKKEGFTPLEIEAVMVKSDQNSFSSDLFQLDLNTLRSLFASKKGRTLQDEEIKFL